MKPALTLIILILSYTLAFSQQNYQDVVYLKNGGIIRGMIIEQIPNKSIKIETADRNVFVYQLDEIDRITKEPVQEGVKNSGKKYNLKRGYTGIIEVGYASAMDDFGDDFMKFNIINGYRINPYLFFGIGTGFRYHYEYEYFYMPYFIDFRANFLDKNVSPYVSIDAGYSSDLTNSFTGVGFMSNLTIGACFRVGNNKTLIVGIGLGYAERRTTLL